MWRAAFRCQRAILSKAVLPRRRRTSVPWRTYYPSSTGLLHPSNGATYVRCRDRWFWIDDKDYQSKTIFAFIVHLLSLAEGEKTQQLPVITIPVG